MDKEHYLFLRVLKLKKVPKLHTPKLNTCLPRENHKNFPIYDTS
jgi:hypothetical protein